MIATITTGPPAMKSNSPTFNLWTEPWIVVLWREGRTDRLGLRDCLRDAHRLDSLADSSPLVVASVQRLLASIAQDIFRPSDLEELADLIKQGEFDTEAIDTFGATYGHRFDLFSDTEPFLQTSDVPPELPKRKSETKTVAYLFPEEPAATNINHFSHRYDDDYQYAPASAAAGLITIPAFATSGGAGIRPSINGVPPLYVLPAGETLFQTIALSIVTHDYQPRVANADDRPAWRGPTVVGKQETVNQVGFLESLTFPARRVRLFPEVARGRCSRTGDTCDILVRRMAFEMGRSRPKDAAPWFDPFAAYRIREKQVPVPVRPQAGKALWREFGTLFHTASPTSSGIGDTVPPGVVRQLADLEDYGVVSGDAWRFRCIGMRTDMKAKVFEWVDDTLDVPVGLLADRAGQIDVREAITRSEDWAREVLSIHRRVYGRDRNDLDEVRQRLRVTYWQELAQPFRSFVTTTTEPRDRAETARGWVEMLFRVGEQVLTEATDAAGDRGDALRQRAEALRRFHLARGRRRKEWLG